MKLMKRMVNVSQRMHLAKATQAEKVTSTKAVATTAMV